MLQIVPLRIIHQACFALCATLLFFVVCEPAISRSATTATSQFTISQTISSELSFTVPPSNVTMSPTLGGLSGGTANGSTLFVITSGNTLGYTVTLMASSSLGMIGNASSSQYIPAYVPSTPGVPDFSFATPARAYFGYTTEASTTSDLAQAFKDNGSTCNTGSGDTVDSCWLNATTTAYTIITRSGPTASTGATTTLKFRVVITPNPNPVIPDDTYVATTTLTATTN